MGAVLSHRWRRGAGGTLVLMSTTLHFDGWNVSPWRRLLPLAYLPLLRQRMSFRRRRPSGSRTSACAPGWPQAMATSQVSAVGAARLSAAALYESTRLIRHVRAQWALCQPALVFARPRDGGGQTAFGA